MVSHITCLAGFACIAVLAKACRCGTQLEEEKMDFDAKYGSIEEEIAEKSKRLKKLYANYQVTTTEPPDTYVVTGTGCVFLFAGSSKVCASHYGTFLWQMKKQEIHDIQDEFQREKEEMLEQIRTITQQIKLKDLVIASFIPPNYQQKIMQHCQWNDYEGAWAIDGLAHTGNFVRARKEKEMAQEKDRESDERGYSAENPDGVIQVRMQPQPLLQNLSIHVAEKPIFSLCPSGVDGAIRRLLELQGLAVGESAALSNVYFSYKALDEELYRPDGQPLGRTVGGGRPASARKPRPKSGRPGTAKKKPIDVGTLRDSVADLGDDTKKKAEKAAYPEARGLVKDRRSRH
eukprot:scaffold18570_cov46-Prasinocladus_malaysianus.AAC.2